MSHSKARCALLAVCLGILAARYDAHLPAQAPTQTPADDTNVLGLPPKSVSAKGMLLIAGGGKTPDAVYDEFIRLAGGNKARIVLIPSAYDWEGLEQIRRRFQGWLTYHVADFQFLDTDSRETADTDAFVKPLLEATGVWFSGGDQSRLMQRYVGTKVEAALRKILERGGVVGGISAGAAVQSKVMMRSGETEPAMGDGLGLASRTVIDTHFSERGRHTRLIRALDERPGYVGLGLDEGAALVMQGSHLRAIGRSSVTVCVGVEDDQPMLVHRLKAGEEAELVSAPTSEGSSQTPIALKRRDKKVAVARDKPVDAQSLTSSK